MYQLIIVPHPKRKILRVKLRTNNTNAEYFQILYDRCKDESKNEDPFIWNDHFLYTFCHGNDVFTKDLINKCTVIGDKTNKSINQEKIYIVFVSPYGNGDTFAIDTIIKIDSLIKLPLNGRIIQKNGKKIREKGEMSKASLKSILEKTPLKDSKYSIIQHHFPGIDKNNNFIEHPRRNLWIAMGDKNLSFLPMVKCKGEYKPFRFNKEDSNKIRKLIQGHKSNREKHGYYVAKKSSNRIRTNQELSDTFDSIQNIISTIICNNSKQRTLYKLRGNEIKDLRPRL